MTPRICLAGFAALALALACGSELSAPSPGGPVTPPEPPTTGNKWVEDSQNGDGSRCFVLQDEECGGVDAADYLDYFEAPIFRTGHAAGDHLYAVDGTNVWILDVKVPTAPERIAVQSGVGRALAVTGQNSVLYVAAADFGVATFEVDPADATRLLRVGEVPLPGPALDVALRPDGKVLYAAIGGAGLAAISLDDEGHPEGTPTTVPLPGFASGVTAQGLQVFVAGCSGLTAVSAATLLPLSTLAIEVAEGGAPAPVKDVAVAGEVAALAAGRWGMIFVDVSNPAEMVRLGNQTEREDLLYYGNGVTASHGSFYLAAGDWGVDRVSVQQVAAGAVAETTPTTFPRYCTEAENPDRKPATEYVTVLPPPRIQDPLDVIPVGDVLFAAGDASRLGLRAIDVYALAPNGVHAYSGRYEEPRRVRAVAAGDGQVLVSGVISGVYTPTATSSLLSRQAELPTQTAQPRALAVCGDGRVASLDDEGTLFLEGREAPVRSEVAPVLVASGPHLVTVEARGQLQQYALTDHGDVDHLRSLSTEPFTYGAAHAFVGDHLFISSGAWAHTQQVDLSDLEATPTLLQSPAPTRAQLGDPSAWRSGPPLRVLVPTQTALVEVTSFGGRATAVLHPLDGGGEPRTLSLPPGHYVGGTAEGSRLVLVQGDRARYRTTLVEVDLDDETQEPLTRTQVFLGSAVGTARLGDVLYVADYEAGIRAFSLSSEEGVTHLGVAELGAGGAP